MLTGFLEPSKGTAMIEGLDIRKDVGAGRVATEGRGQSVSGGENTAGRSRRMGQSFTCTLLLNPYLSVHW